MSEQEWTQGKWIVGVDDDIGAYVASEDTTYDTVCLCRKEHAHLLASAKELYDALKGLLDIGDFNLDSDGDFVAAARAALAKAKGEQQC